MVNLNKNKSSKISLSCLLLLFLQHLFSIGADNYNLYHAVEDLAINCGAIGNSTSDLDQTRRTWIGDNNSNDQFTLIEHEKDSVSASATQVNPSVKQVPYYTARLSFSEFTYSFRVTDGQKFIRLHFFPATYGYFDRSNSLFSVKAGFYTLLKDFNASAISEESFFREYCINVGQARSLNITFTPTLTHKLDSYAFINGIELVSMPTNLYYSKPGGEELKLVGHGNSFPIMNNTALETVYRINVGGSPISSEKDTGMYRYWDIDDSFLEKKYEHSLPAVYGSDLRPKYEIIPSYTAPDDVYLTARSYGMNATTNYNVTWNFKVDTKFIYMVRLHFCELELTLTEANQRVFQIFVADMLAEKRADVILWTGYNLVPYYKDYAILFDKSGSSKQLNLSIKLQPVQTRFAYDVILNGVEIFKVSDIGTGNLAGVNPEPRQSPPQSLVPPTKPPKRSKVTTVVATVAGAGSGIIVLSFICFLIFRRTTLASDNNRNSKLRHIPLAPSKSSQSYGSSLPSDLCRYFSLAQITAATYNFDEVLVIGVGGFGKVYKGYIDENNTPVAIKRLKSGSQQGAHEFKTEIEMLSQLRHLHLVSLVGYCNDENEMILVYDFMARGTLRDHLYDSDNKPLSWKQRLEICLGAAQGLHYLHTGAKHSIIHRDIKTTNILIDEKWVAKVSDFGLSKIGPTGMSQSHISTVVKGSIGYLDPEYYKRQRLTHKSDVYSFGVVLLEVLCARPPLLLSMDKHQASLVEWARGCHKNGEIDRMVDPFLRGTIVPQCLNRYIDTAFNCLLEDGNQRLSMNDVVWGLEFTMQLQESIEGGLEVVNKREEIALLKNSVNDVEENDVLFMSTDELSTRSKTSKMTTER
ncbi:hypothetical protein L6164_007571 [Bauhinia variegata]|uniref:Uncharacterized protein n=1 Tax=Bauhinia variegata TaxID=167791 RepID=A0ACB9PE25_BAUVA|nr:hypothetical protein L6164_007571 [Bauhinia variegata]